MTHTSQKKKRQHYVPRFLLRNFSPDQRRISLFILERRRRVDDAGLKEQCYRDYFYGREPDLEDALAEMEGEAARLLVDADPDRLESLTTRDLFRLKRFVFYQQMRTASAADHLDEMLDGFMKALLASNPDFHERYSKEDLDLIRVRWTDAPLQALATAERHMPLLLDLDLRFLVSGAPNQFVISDHPVVAYNQFLEHHRYYREMPGHTAIALKGVQLVMPVRPHLAIIVYDPSTYAIGSSKRRVCGIGKKDVSRINAMQAANAQTCIYFRADGFDATTLDELADAHKTFSPFLKPNAVATPIQERPDGGLSNFIAQSPGGLRMGLKLSLAQDINRTCFGKGPAMPIPVRSWEALDFIDYCEEFRKKRTNRKNL